MDTQNKGTEDSTGDDGVALRGYFTSHVSQAGIVVSTRVEIMNAYTTSPPAFMHFGGLYFYI